MIAEGLAVKAAMAGGKALAKFFSDLGNRNTNALQEAMEVDRRSHAARVAQLVEVLMVEWQKQATDTEELKAKVEQMAANTQFQRLHANLEYEAVRSTLDERKKMLAAAAAGLCDPSMSIEDKARVERTLRQLDPKDVELLDVLRRTNAWRPRTPQEEIENPPNVRATMSQDVFAEFPLSRGVLLISGCAAERNVLGDNRPLDVSPLGEMVLNVLATYLQD